MFASLAGKRLAAVATFVVLAAGAGGTAAAVGTSALGTSAVGTPGPPSHVVSVPLNGRTGVALEIKSGTAILQVSVAKLPGTLMRVSTPDGVPAVPVLSGNAPVTLSLAGAAGNGGPYAVTVVLNSSVLWSLEFAGGTQRTTADLRGGKVAGIAFTAGSDTVALALPRPSGTLPILLAGGASRLLISLPAGVPARVTAGGGAAQVTVDDQSQTGVAGGTVIMSPGWATATSRLDVDATGGVSQVLVTRYPAGS
jgi:hypothetical protein